MKKRNNTFLLAARDIFQAKQHHCAAFCCNTITLRAGYGKEIEFFGSLFNTGEYELVWWKRIGSEDGPFDYESRILALLLADIIYNEKA